MVHMNAGCLQPAWTVVEFDTCRKVDWLLRADCVPSSVTGSNSDGCFPVGTLKEQVYPTPPRTIRRSHGKTSSSLLGIFKRMPCSALPSALKWMEATLSTYCYYDMLMVWSFRSLCHKTMMCSLKIKCHRTYVIQYFLLVF